MKTIYGAVQNTDFTEGRGPTRVVAWFTIKSDAESVNASLEGVQGTKNDCKVQEAYLYEYAYEYRDTEREKLKKAALSKLTQAEREVLGIRS